MALNQIDKINFAVGIRSQKSEYGKSSIHNLRCEKSAAKIMPWIPNSLKNLRSSLLISLMVNLLFIFPGSRDFNFANTLFTFALWFVVNLRRFVPMSPGSKPSLKYPYRYSRSHCSSKVGCSGFWEKWRKKKLRKVTSFSSEAMDHVCILWATNTSFDRLILWWLFTFTFNIFSKFSLCVLNGLELMFPKKFPPKRSIVSVNKTEFQF